MKQLLLCFFILLTSLTLIGQEGTEFWFVAPDVDNAHTDRPIYLRITALSEAATVTISLPANSSFTPLSYSFTPNQFQTIDLTTYINQIETTVIDGIQNTGLHITSTAPIMAYYEVRSSGNNTDIFALKASNAVGKSFMIPAQTTWRSSASYPNSGKMFLVVATEDSTQVTITPKRALVGRAAGVPFTITLMRGQTYYAKATGQTTAFSLEGSEIHANKPIAVTIADDSNHNSTFGGCRDLAGDQLIPYERIGTEYIVNRGYFNERDETFLLFTYKVSDDRIYIMATEDNTNIFLNSIYVANIDKGEQYEFDMHALESCYITTNNPVYVLHVTGFGCEVGMAVVPSLFCTGSTEVSIARSTSESFYLMITVPSGSQGNFSLNGNTTLITAADFNVVPLSGGAWMYARKRFTTTQIPTGSVSRIVNSTSRFHIGVINGGASSGCMYGYFTDFASVKTSPIYHF